MSELSSGQVLSAAREAAGLSLREVADALNLQIHTLEAIEEDAEDRLPAAVFTRGYIRAYAKFLGIESGPWTEAPQHQAPPVEQPDARPRRRIAIEQNHLVGGALVVAVAIVLAIWLFSDTATPDASNDALTAGGTELAVDDINAAGVTVAAGGGGAQSEQSAGPLDAAGQGASPPVRTSADPAAQAGLDRDMNASAPSSVNADFAATDTVQVATPGAGNFIAASDTQPRVADPASTGGVPERRLTEAGEEVLEFEFTDECWVEIKDARNEVLYANLGRPGTRWRFVGAGPFQLLLGYAAGAALTYNDEPVALVPHTRNNVARLVLGQ